MSCYWICLKHIGDIKKNRIQHRISANRITKGGYPKCEVPLIFHVLTKGCWVVRAYKHARTLTHSLTHTHTHIYIYTYTHIYIYIHTHTHTHTCVSGYRNIGNRLRRGLSGVQIPTEQLVSLFSILSRSPLGPAQPPIRWVPGFFPGCKPVATWGWLLTSK